MRLFGTLFWGLLFIVVGCAFIVKYVLNLDIPILTIIIGFILIYLGMAIILGGSTTNRKHSVFFGESSIKTENPNNEYNFVFSKGSIDLTGVKLENMDKYIKVHTVFADGTVKISPDIPAILKVTSAFGTANLPGNSITFGEYTYRTKNYKDGAPCLRIEADVVFGKLDVIE